MKRLAIVVAVGALFSGAAVAQQGTVQRDVNQQERIEQGLKSGQLTTQEASRLEAEQSRIQRDQARALQDGNLTPAEKARLTREQNQASRDINRLDNNKATGNPNSASSQRMQADVQRNINQQQRIEQGVKSGQLTNRETARLERGESRIDRAEAKAGRDGHVGAGEQRRIQSADNRESRRIYRQKHDAQTK
jgi:hypothetical protein